MYTNTINLFPAITKPELISSCQRLDIDNFNWGGDYLPASYARLAFCENEGLIFEITANEKPIPCTYKSDFDPVYLDSCMEGFFALNPNSDKYINIEINAHNAIIASLGCSRHERISLSDAQLDQLTHKVIIGTDEFNNPFWKVCVVLPTNLLLECFDLTSFGDGSMFSFNFYKIAGGNINTHFASFSKIISKEPDFHLPQFFAKGKIVSNMHNKQSSGN